ncbi:MAG: hypothetical protein LBU45_01105 [Azoarcus sp.]|nr:hypothetical protein [Azoarcus sp.]
MRNYETQFDARTKLAERLLFPVSAIEQNGIEDARFVRFTDGGGAARYYATYTAYDGKNILSQLLETDDFLHFAMRSLSGGMTANKGLALFPRKIGGRHQPDAPHQPDARYAMLARTDGENIYIMFSNDLYTWNEGTLLAAPQYPWEFMQLGNCGSPIEIDEGWLVLTHGVGLVRTYSIGALLLDKDDPATVIGRLPEPLIVPGEQEQGGYVPGVVYTCGALLHQGRLIIPYGSADRAIAFTSVAVKELVGNMR